MEESAAEEDSSSEREKHDSGDNWYLILIYAVAATALGMSMVVIGTANLRQCVVEPMIPVYLVGKRKLF